MKHYCNILCLLQGNSTNRVTNRFMELKEINSSQNKKEEKWRYVTFTFLQLSISDLELSNHLHLSKPKKKM